MVWCQPLPVRVGVCVVTPSSENTLDETFFSRKSKAFVDMKENCISYFNIIHWPEKGKRWKTCLLRCHLRRLHTQRARCLEFHGLCIHLCQTATLTSYDFIYKPAPILDHTMLHLVGIFGWRSGKCWKTTSIDIEEGKGDWVVGLPMFYYSIKEDAK